VYSVGANCDIGDGTDTDRTAGSDRMESESESRSPKVSVLDCSKCLYVLFVMWVINSYSRTAGDYSVVITMTKLSGHISMHPFDKYSAFSGWLFRNS